MSVRGGAFLPVVAGLVLVGAVAVATKALLVASERAAERPPSVEETPEVARPIGATGPIRTEAGVFRTPLRTLAIGDPSTPRRDANPRTMHSFRLRRSFPGAPPRIPHGLTAEEYRTNTCNSCHRRGGFSPRFGAYVPVTPHPEWEACLQCHVGDDQVTGVVLPTHDPNSICRQCHDPATIARTITAPEWLTSNWPRLSAKAPNRPPPPIPHDLTTRNNCVTCHAGPGAVGEIRTAHPEWTNCRQCHLAETDDATVFVRPEPSPSQPAESPR